MARPVLVLAALIAVLLVATAALASSALVPRLTLRGPVERSPYDANATTVQQINATLEHNQSSPECAANISVHSPGFTAHVGDNVTFGVFERGYCWNSVTRVWLDPSLSADFRMTAFVSESHGESSYVASLVVLRGNLTIPTLDFWMYSPLDANGR